MIKYFIESPDGKWITNPQRWGEHGIEFLTEDPFKAWAFELFSPFGDSIEEPGTGILSTLQDEGCLLGYEITEQNFTEYLGELTSHQREIPGVPRMIQTTYRDGTSLTYIPMPMWDSPALPTYKSLIPQISATYP